MAVTDKAADECAAVADEIAATGGGALALAMDVSKQEEAAGLRHDAGDAVIHIGRACIRYP